ncbi:BMP-binding endothelial regulator protein isoform X2 [Chelonus insularis]|nr:BMP-binding endothelial regulator protein isoform X2 [Chelonus insularis]XP_034945609.1 BMP-binding endothelial regulator protein isoform X2 [Chelonus insularis]XP_034945610.1 BMP-binding endothelial regulator protein isoform X2 [Chelonus insularis]XP_034945611.1 BMP-binding endothelial regulator protein isoform X2 [Chelonus insularis]XP_034945612.1 BMP-binding endothelial regulator protein isoform X2 [Chelonus insularis]XP_034945613.1 BMP-binding endothelial regulator protein isoform X2 [C
MPDHTTYYIVVLMTLTFKLLLIIQQCQCISESIIGSRETCEIEGEDFTVDKIPNTRCFSCICKNGFVECVKHQCPSIEGCYTILDRSTDECCHRCKGCVKDGIHHASGTEWTDDNDPCRILTCKAGVITESKLKCYTPCANPIPPLPGQCCPTCHGCYVNGQRVTSDRSVKTTEDPCVTCRCKDNRLTCTKKACPVQHCPVSRIAHEPGECCPYCSGNGRYMLPPKGACILGQAVYNSGSTFYVDHCTRCLCTNSTISCYKETCPILECTNEHQVTLPGRCCPQCPVVEESRASCTYGGRTYLDGESWKLDSCKACACMQGKVRCAMPMCSPLSVPCPPNSRLEHPEGQCCPKCVESDGVCTVFGDPHYKTFDGKFFSFKGSCKYQLVSDCLTHTFSIRVTNDARSTRSSAWTKTIALKIGDLKVNLGQKMKIKVNGKKINIPFELPNKLEVNRTADSILVSTKIGIKILWDGISFIEVSVPSLYRNHLCGLCGNFNSLTKDDFMTRKGRLVQDPYLFGQSWTVGSKKKCPKSRVHVQKHCRRRENHRLCNRLRSMTFDSCHKKVNPAMYYKACLQDMCECPTNNCYCQSFVAYVHECQRLGIQLSNWRTSTKCRTVWELEKNNYQRRRH